MHQLTAAGRKLIYPENYKVILFDKVIRPIFSFSIHFGRAFESLAITPQLMFRNYILLKFTLF